MIDLDNVTADTAYQIATELEEMFDSPGWAIVKQFLDERAEGRTKELYQMCPSSVPEMVAFAKLKGGLDELSQIAYYLEAFAQDARSVYNRLKEMEEDVYED